MTARLLTAPTSEPTTETVDATVGRAVEGWAYLRALAASDRLDLLSKLADALTAHGADLIAVAIEETHFAHDRLSSELGVTCAPIRTLDASDTATP